jgi:peptidoglycan hydrolase-like protein with peptidoglycan-binding domain
MSGSTSGSMTGSSGSATSNDSSMQSSQHSGSMQGSQSAGDAAVREVQQALQSKGHDVGQIDGIMGEKTQSALRVVLRDRRQR